MARPFFCYFSRSFRLLVSTVTESEHALAPGTDVVWELVLMAVNERFPTLMPTLYPGLKATGPRRYVSWDVMWRTLRNLTDNKAPAVNRTKCFPPPVCSTGTWSSAPSGLWFAGHGRGQRRVPSQSLS